MPTAARLVSAILLALSAAIVVMIAIEVYPTIGRRMNSLLAGAVAVGLFNGWFGIGRTIAMNEGSPVLAGLTAGVSVFFWVLLVYGIEGMIQGILAHAYYQPMTALLQIPARMIQFGKMAMNVPIGGSMVVLSAFVGVMAKRTSRKWS